MKSIWKNDYTITIPAEGMTTYTLYDDTEPVYSGRIFSNGEFNLDLYEIYIKRKYDHNMNDIINNIWDGGFKVINFPELNLSLEYEDEVKTDIVSIPIQYHPEETEPFTIHWWNVNQLVMACVRSNFTDHLLYSINGLQFEDSGYKVENGHIIIITTVKYLYSIFGEEPQRLDIKCADDEFNICEFVEDECNANNMYLVTRDAIDYFNIDASDITFMNKKKTFMNKFKNDVIYDNDVNYSYNITIDATYTNELFEKLNDNYGAIFTIGNDVNYGHIDESSIKSERYKQSFKIKI